MGGPKGFPEVRAIPIRPLEVDKNLMVQFEGPFIFGRSGLITLFAVMAAGVSTFS
jgi:hypothetical protein